MYSYEDRIRAVELYIKLGKRLRATIRHLGYQTKNALKGWYRECERGRDLPIGCQRRPKYSQVQKEVAVEHTRTKVNGPQTNGICERFHQTMKNEFYASAFRRKLYSRLKRFNAMWTSGSRATMPSARTRASIATARPRCRHSLRPARWCRKNNSTGGINKTHRHKLHR